MRRPISAALLLGVIAIPRVARADDYSIHVLGNVQTTWTDNLFATETDRRGDFLTQLRPGVLLSYETPRTIHQLSYDLDASIYAENDDAFSLGHLAAWHGFFLTSPRTELQASATYSSGQVNGLTMRSATMPVEAGESNGNGGNTFWGLDAGQSLSFTATRELRLSEGVRARRFATTDAAGNDSGGTELGLNVGVDRGWTRSALAVGVSAAFVRMVNGTEDNDTINGSLIVSFRRDVSPRWTALLDGGVAAVIPIDGEKFVQPTIGANIGYTPRWGQAGLQIRRAMAPNFYLAQNTITDSVNLNASLPLPWLSPDPNLPRLTTQGSIGVSRTQQILGGTLDGATDVASVDLSLQYNPRPGLTFALRGQHMRQIIEQQPMMGTQAFPYDRTTMMLSATWRFPDRLAAEIPLRNSLRVDRSDNTAVGEEVAPSVAP